MISLNECKDFAGLVLDELILGAGPTEAHRSKLSAYELNLKWGAQTVRELIIADIRVARDLGAARLAADLLVVLRMFLHEHPEARRSSESAVETRRPRSPRLNHNARMPCCTANPEQSLVGDPLL